MADVAKPWGPTKPVSKGASGYHDAVVDAEYYIENLKELAKIVREKIKDKDIVLDFGAGTGASSICLLNEIKVNFKLWLVDNSAAWLGKAYEIFKGNPNVELFLLEKVGNGFATLAETVGTGTVNHVISANTLHLVPDLHGTFSDMRNALKEDGTITFQSGNILRNGRKEGVLMVDDTINRVHDIALDIIRNNDEFRSYRAKLQENIEKEKEQRSFVFPAPRNLETYLSTLKEAGFRNLTTFYKLIKIRYTDWLNFLRVHRLQAGILPEVGGKEASPEEEAARDKLITLAAYKLFKELEETNAMADSSSFTCEWVYVSAIRS